jgi:N-methylhydantoinase A
MDDSVRLGVDVGGTFTDVVLLTDGAVTTAKVPTTPADQSEGVLRGIERACDAAGVAPAAVDEFRHAMTVSTNALLEGEGAETALVTTAGFADVLAIGRQDRPALYDLTAEQPDPLVPADRRYEIDERATPDGIEEAVDEAAVRDLADRLPAAVESVAVCLLHAYAHPDNEQQVARVLREELDATVTSSHEVLPTFREYERTATTAADARVTPLIDSYVGTLEDRAADRGLPAPWIMQSNGGIADPATVRAHAVTTALSGPAAGVVGASLFEPPDSEGVISFDMGGTSTDVGLVRDGAVERTTEARIGGHPIGVPMVDVETVGAGGGSIAHVDAGGALRVGPQSAGAQPGPACYGRGGDEPTVTDACLVRGYLGDGTDLGGDVSLDGEAARDVIADLADAAGLDDPQSTARGVYDVATARMARAIRRVTVEQGHDPRGFDLVAFGGAGPMFAAALADRLGVERVRIPQANGVLSALGLLAADEHHDAVRTDRRRLAEADPDAIAAEFETLASSVLDQTSDPDEATVTRGLDCRYAGQSHELSVALDGAFDPTAVASQFHALHERARGFALEDEPVEVVGLRASATVAGERPTISHDGTESEPTRSRSVAFANGAQQTPVYDRDRLAAGLAIDGPAVCEGGESTVVVPPAWRATVDDRGTLVLEAHA